MKPLTDFLHRHVSEQPVDCTHPQRSSKWSTLKGGLLNAVSNLFKFHHLKFVKMRDPSQKRYP